MAYIMNRFLSSGPLSEQTIRPLHWSFVSALLPSSGSLPSQLLVDFRSSTAVVPNSCPVGCLTILALTASDWLNTPDPGEQG